MGFGDSLVRSFCDYVNEELVFHRDNVGVYPNIKGIYDISFGPYTFFGVSVARDEVRLFDGGSEVHLHDDVCFYDFDTDDEWVLLAFPSCFLKDFREAYFSAFPTCAAVNALVASEGHLPYESGDVVDSDSHYFVVCWLDEYIRGLFEE